MIRTTVTLLALTAALAALVAPANAAPGWRTAAIGQDREDGDYVFMFFSIGARMLDVHELRLVSTGSSRTKSDVSVTCYRGSNEASRKKTIRLAAKATTGLPLPIRGGTCKVDVNTESDQAGTISLAVQYR